MLGTVLLSTAAAGVAYPLWWNHRSAVDGAALLKRAEVANGLPLAASRPDRSLVTTEPPVPATCHPTKRRPGSGPALPAIIQVPRIGLEAPVLNGTGDNVLNDAVGHLSHTTWPGAPGVSIFLAHDVSYFSNLGAVRPGDKVIWIDNCRWFSFVVQWSAVMLPGSPIPVPTGSVDLALVTCYPSDALFWTPERLVVLASFARSGGAKPAVIRRPPSLGFHLQLPRTLADHDLNPSRNYVLLGHLSVGGKPNRYWSTGPDPLRAVQLAFEELTAVKLAVAAHDQAWWGAISIPGEKMPKAIDTSQEFDVTVTAYGTKISSMQLVSPRESVTLLVVGHKLLVSYVSSPKSH